MHRRATIPGESAAKGLADLRGKVLAVPERTKEYCRLFLSRECHKLGQDPPRFFTKQTQPSNVEDALDDVVDGQVQASLVDGVGLKRYEARKPIRAARLKSLLQSAAFPPSTVCYLPERLSRRAVDRFRQALLDLDRSAEGRQILMEWRLTDLEEVPRDYSEVLAEIIKIYPPPTR